MLPPCLARKGFRSDERQALRAIALLVILSILPIYSMAGQASKPTTTLGALEEIPSDSVSEHSFRAVRILFQKKDLDWQPFPNDCFYQACLETITSQYPRSVTWNIGLSGRNLGRVTGLTPNKFAFYAGVGLQEITSKGPVPTIGKRSKEYGGFTESNLLRPLIANSLPYFHDQESWQFSHPTTEVIADLRLKFRDKFPSAWNCANQNDDRAKAWQYDNADIRLKKFYSSKNGWSMAQMVLSGSRCDEPAEGPFVDQWFVISPSGGFTYLGSGMKFLDAGDYDNDGRPEVVFMIDRYDLGGYVLFYDDFKKNAAFEFHYH
jgi:hypothetical protein